MEEEENNIIDGEIEIVETKEKIHKPTGRKAGGKNTPKHIQVMTANKIVDYTIVGSATIKHPDNIALGIKPFSPLTIEQACKETGMERINFYYYRNTIPAIREKHLQFKESRRELLKDKAEDIIYKALHDDLEISDKEVLDTAKWISEKTDQAYNPKVEIEQKSLSLNFNVSLEEMEKEIMDMIKKNK